MTSLHTRVANKLSHTPKAAAISKPTRGSNAFVGHETPTLLAAAAGSHVHILVNVAPNVEPWLSASERGDAAWDPA